MTVVYVAISSAERPALVLMREKSMPVGLR
jgi:hypothetical protein